MRTSKGISFETFENTIMFGLKEMRVNQVGFVNSGKFFLLITKYVFEKKN
jgi:hypothetical protein